MSIFDHFDKNLTTDRKKRKIESDILEYSPSKEDETLEVEEKKSFFSLYVIVAIVTCLLVGQLINLQISQGSFSRLLAEGNRIRNRETPAPRGLIYDRDNKILASNIASYSLELYPLDLPKDKNEQEETLVKIAQISKMDISEIKKTVEERGNTYEPVILKENIDRDSAMLLKIEVNNIPGIAVNIKPIRNYQNNIGSSQILGYVGKITQKELENNPKFSLSDQIGKDGLEKTYEENLQGIPGKDEVEVDSKGRVQRQLAKAPAQPGNNLVLSIRADFQKILTESLSNAISQTSIKAGAAVAMDPKSGQILGMTSLPNYDNNLFSKAGASEEFQKILNDQTKPLFNRAISGIYPSGSTIKPIVASAGLQEGVITPQTTIDDSEGKITVGNWVYPDWKAHGRVDVYKALAESCNVFFYSVGGGWDKIQGLGVRKLDDYLAKFGLGQKSGIDLPAETEGLIPNPEWKEKIKKEPWYLGDTYHMSIGQGDVEVTPLQMARAISAIANGGELLKPHFVTKITGSDGKVIKEIGKEVISSNFVSGDNLAVVRDGMRQAVTSGSARGLSDLPVPVSAKTGTSQFGAGEKTHAWLVAFAPSDDPQIAVVTIVEEGGEGHQAALPVVHDILDWYFNNK